jgi:hypothetical protein
VPALLDMSEEQAASFKRPDDLPEAISKCRTQIASLKAPLASIKKRRNKALAHLDPTFVMHPQKLNAAAALTIPDLVRVFDETERIVRTIDNLYSDVVGELRYLGESDYKAVLDLIADAKCAEAAEYEKLSGEPCFWPLPAKCAERKKAKPQLSEKM